MFIKKQNLIFVLSLLSACSFFKSGSEKNNYFIQAELHNEIIHLLRKEIKPLINNIIKKELNLKENKEFPEFLTPKTDTQRLTFYYIYDLPVNLQHHIVHAFDELYKNNKKEFDSINTALSSKADFFGEKNEEIVILIDDYNNELNQLNEKIKASLNKTNLTYKQKNHVNLYDVQKSEQYKYIPHIALGRLQSNSIKALIKNAQADSVLASIKERIKKEVFPILKKLVSKENNKIRINNFGIFNVTKKELVASYLVN